jgi:hypothetical protein
MPKINVYLPDALASAVREAGVPVSAVCQAALSDAVERVGRTRRGITAIRDPATPAAALRRIGQGVRERMTPRLVLALRVAGSDAEGQDRTGVSSLDLLRGLLDDGENFAVRLLVAQGVDVDALAAGAAAGDAGEPGPSLPESALPESALPESALPESARPESALPESALPESTLPEPGAPGTFLARLTMPARLACAAALEAVVELGHNYVGCEHLLIGLTASEGQAHDLLAAHGAQTTALREALSATTALRETLSAAAAGGGALARSRTANQADAIADLTRRLEAIERQLAEGRA